MREDDDAPDSDGGRPVEETLVRLERAALVLENLHSSQTQDKTDSNFLPGRHLQSHCNDDRDREDQAVCEEVQCRGRHVEGTFVDTLAPCN